MFQKLLRALMMKFLKEPKGPGSIPSPPHHYELPLSPGKRKPRPTSSVIDSEMSVDLRNDVIDNINLSNRNVDEIDRRKPKIDLPHLNVSDDTYINNDGDYYDDDNMNIKCGNITSTERNTYSNSIHQNNDYEIDSRVVGTGSKRPQTTNDIMNTNIDDFYSNGNMDSKNGNLISAERNLTSKNKVLRKTRPVRYKSALLGDPTLENQLPATVIHQGGFRNRYKSFSLKLLLDKRKYLSLE
jgi:hypothetical protein